MRVEGHVSDLYVIFMTACLILVCTKFLFTILLDEIQHVYYVYGVTYMQVADIECLFLQHIALCCRNSHSLVLHVLRCTVDVDHYHYHLLIVCGSILRDSNQTTLMGSVTLQLHRVLCDCNCYTHGPRVAPTIILWSIKSKLKLCRSTYQGLTTVP